ncbi:MAG TPA: right-handed parallel beta-helix repeat-containing protein, partial [Thermoanaerobaculia bacterium]|nr:right-handed parallel beta-helix repeat-containing protein [Thermoanaerobaculia bacterium]
MIRRSRSLLPAVAFGLGAFLLPLALGAAVYYVAPFASGGRDTNLGTLGQPWETLQHAADTVGPGDTVYARAGGYAGFQMTTSGLSAARIVFTNYPGETVSIVSDLPVRHDGINLEGASYITVRGFHVNGAGHAGIRAVACNGVEIVGNVLTNNQVWGVLTGCCDDVRVTGNIAAGSIEQHGIYVSNSGDRPVIVGNVVYGNNQNGIHMNGDIDTPCDSGGTTFDGVISGALVEGNTLFDNGANGGVGGGSAINCDGVQTSLIRNNLVYASHASGISLYQIDGAQPASGNRVENNTVLVAAGTGRWALNIQDDAANTVVRNNILWSSRAPRG